MEAAKKVGIPKERVYILEMPKEITGDKKVPFKTVGQLIEDGKKLPQVDPLKWTKGQGATQTAYLCYSSGTSGLPVSINSFKFPYYYSCKKANFLLTERRQNQPSQCDLKCGPNWDF